MIVDMIHFIAWPDHKGSDPQSVLQIVDFANQIYKEKGLTCPMVIHCSAGVGRTGTFCTIDSVLCHLKQTHIPPISRDLFEPLEWEHLNNDLILLTVNRFRHQRIWAVQSEEQFSLCYDAILIRLNEWHDSNINKTW
jgi:protein-tyrosine phosphatase